jgi:geranylgeranyl diphosphate synthase type II
MEYFEEYKSLVEKRIAALNLEKEPRQLYQPISYTLAGGGKRLRPVLVLVACDLYGGNVQEALDVAIGIEVFHNFTLLHDDIMDKSEMRRGKDTVHKKWNPNIAILAGDTMFALACHFIQSAKSQQFSSILSTFTQTAIEVCEGQQFDMDFEERNAVSISEYINMIRLKTAVLLGASLKAGALVANATIQQADLLYDFGVNAGIAFQLKDDFLDAFGNAEKFGKKIGSDILANKKTWLYLKCLEMAEDNDKKRLLDFNGQKKFDEQSKVSGVLALYDKYNIKNEATYEMECFFRNSTEIMNKVVAPIEKKAMLVDYARWLFERDY